MSFGLQTISAIARIQSLGLLRSPAIYSLTCVICSLKRLVSQGGKRLERGGSKMKETSRKILGRFVHVKLYNVHLQMYRLSTVDKVKLGSHRFSFKPNLFKRLELI